MRNLDEAEPCPVVGRCNVERVARRGRFTTRLVSHWDFLPSSSIGFLHNTTITFISP